MTVTLTQAATASASNPVASPVKACGGPVLAPRNIGRRAASSIANGAQGRRMEVRRLVNPVQLL
jgi:hypothetical protein